MVRVHKNDKRPASAPKVVVDYVRLWTPAVALVGGDVRLLRAAVLQGRPQRIADALAELDALADLMAFLRSNGVRLTGGEPHSLFIDEHLAGWERDVERRVKAGVIKEGTARSMVSRVVALGRRIGGPGYMLYQGGHTHRTPVNPPMPDVHFAQWELIARAQTTIISWRFQGLLYCCRGAGCESEDLRFLRGTHCVRRWDGALVIQIPGPHARTAIVLDRYADALEAVARQLGDDLIVGVWPHRNTPASDLVDAVQGGSDLMRPMPRALRRAYVVEMLCTDVSPLVLAEQLGRDSFAELESAAPYALGHSHDRSPLRVGAHGPLG
jgi:hypothetical protein